MSAGTSIATAVILTAWLLAGEVRADCLDGHLENFTITAWVTTIWGTPSYGVCPPPEKMTSPSGGAECFIPYVCCQEGGCVPCLPGPKASYSVSTSPTGYTITATVEVDPTVNDEIRRHGYLHEARVVVDVDFERVGGFVDCTFHGVNRRLAGGVVFEWGYDPRFNLTCIASENYLPGAVTCEATVTCTPIAPSMTRYWLSATGGAYEDGTNWQGGCAPAHDAQRSDTAVFQLATASHIPVTAGPLATAGQWIVQNGLIAFGGRGQVFSTSVSPPSLSILQGGQLRLLSGASLDSVHASVGASGATNSVLEVKGGGWTNTASAKIGRGSVDVLDGGSAITGALSIGSGNGPGAVHVTGDVSTFDVTGEFVVGDATAGTLEIDKGAFSVTPVTATPVIGKSTPGRVTVRGDYGSSSSYGMFLVNHSLIVGDGASGRLNVESGGSVSVAQDLVVNGYGANPGGEVVVDGQGAIGILEVVDQTLVSATELHEILVQNGGRLSTHELHIGDRQVRLGAADVTLRGASGVHPTLSVGTAGGPGVGTFVGQAAPGQLNVEAGATAELNSGLHLGEGSQGIVRVFDRATLTVAGETQVGIGGPGFLNLDTAAHVENNGDLKIGLGGDVPSGSVNVGGFSHLRVNGVLSVGASGAGFLTISSGSGVRCGTLVVGGTAPLATGIIDVDFFSALTVDGNVQVGVGAGPGQIHLKGDSAMMTLNRTMTIGNPAAGPGWGIVFMADAAGASIVGTGNIVVNKNGCLIGSGSIPSLSTGGVISMDPSDCPGLVVPPTMNASGAVSAQGSPRTLTIDGDLELLPGGVLIIGYDGLNPGEFDVVHVTGQTTLGGRLEVHFRSGFSPDDPAAFIQSQDFVEADQGTTGDYDERIYAFPDLFADFDDDGDKDLSDVAAFQNCFGLSGAALEPACVRADWEDNNDVNATDARELVQRLTGPN